MSAATTSDVAFMSEDMRHMTPIASTSRTAESTNLQTTWSARRGFTLVELMVTVAIIAVLLSLLAPALQRTIGSARGFKCQAALRNVAFDFALFADPEIHGSRGQDSQFNNRFRIETFQESEYGIDEFWAHQDASSVTFESGGELDHMRCPEVAGAVTLKRDVPCTTAGAIGPPTNVSYGFNARLHRDEVQSPYGGVSANPVFMSSEILQQPDVPLLWDVDGEAALAKNIHTPQFSAPALDSLFLYANDRHWYPGMRHNGAMNVAFVGGHVVSSRTPLDEPGWQWGYSPR